ncbi:MAG: flagellar hook protein FlgE [Bacteroidota bacterium]
MIRSLRTGVSGLKSSQVRMDVVGNNIANVNTAAFKRSRAAFGEVMGQQLLGVGRLSGGTGVNPAFVGLGVAIQSIDKNWGQGSLESTGVQTDLALAGDGFFIARNGDQQMLTRAGNFTFNAEGNLVTANGMEVQGWSFDGEGQLVTGELQDVMFDPTTTVAARASSNAVITGNLPQQFALPDPAATPPVPGESTAISTVLYDSQGAPHDITITFEKTANNQWTYAASVAAGADDPFGGNLPSGTLEFDVDGQLLNVDGNTDPLSSTFDWDNNFASLDPAGNTRTMTLDFSKMTQFDASDTAVVSQADGSSSGSLDGYAIDSSGILTLNFTNGQQRQVFQLAVGNVNNPNGLEMQGENMYVAGGASGDLQVGRAGRDLRTNVVAGSLEMSNVDLATEFTEMIVSQRGYQAAARIVTTSDELLQETVSLKR